MRFYCQLLLTSSKILSDLKAALGNFRVNINNFLCSIWKKCNTHRQLLEGVSEVVGEYCENSVFSHAWVFRIVKNVPIIFAQSVALSILSVLIGVPRCASYRLVTLVRADKLLK